jgi:hypothetical protein
MNEYKDYTRKQLIAMLEESNEIIEAVSNIFGATMVTHLYMNHRSEEE